MRSFLFAIAVFVPNAVRADDSPRHQYEALVAEFGAQFNASVEALKKATDDNARMAASYQRPQPHEFAPRFLALAEKYPDDPAALDCLIWVATKCLFGPHAEKAYANIASKFSRSERIKDFCGECSRYGEPFPAYEEMLRVVLNNNPHRDVQGAACLALADYLKVAKEKTESNLVKLALGGEKSLGKVQRAELAKMKARGLEKVADESAALFQRVIDEYSDLRFERNYPANAGELAKSELFVLRNLCIGRTAPEIIGKDIHGKPMKLSDFRGKVVVLDFGSHRSCGVCRQFYPHLRAMVEQFKGKPFALLGISVDDDVNELKALAAKGENTWPIWWDGENLQGPLAAQWVIRAMPTFFVLDPKGVIRNKGFIQPGEIEQTAKMILKEMDEAEGRRSAAVPPDRSAAGP
jgi:peroxiredoxin